MKILKRFTAIILGILFVMLFCPLICISFFAFLIWWIITGKWEMQIIGNTAEKYFDLILKLAEI